MPRLDKLNQAWAATRTTKTDSSGTGSVQNGKNRPELGAARISCMSAAARLPKEVNPVVEI